MATEPEIIRRQMKATREALGDKMERLQCEVVDTIVDTSDCLRQAATVVKEGVEESVQAVRGAVNDSMETIRDALDLSGHVDRRPWLMVGGATALGYVGGRLLQAPRTRPRTEAPATADTMGPRRYPHNLEPQVAAPNGRQVADTSASLEPSAWVNLGTKFEAELHQLKGLGVGTLFGALRDIVAQSMPEPLEQQVADIIDGFTEKLGGTPIRGHIVPRRRFNTCSTIASECGD